MEMQTLVASKCQPWAPFKAEHLFVLLFIYCEFPFFLHLLPSSSLSSSLFLRDSVLVDKGVCMYSGWLRTPYIDQAVFELRDPPSLNPECWD